MIGYCAHSQKKKKKKTFTSATTPPLLSSPASADFQRTSSSSSSPLAATTPTHPHSPLSPRLNTELYLSKPGQDSISRRLFGLRSAIFENSGLQSGGMREGRHDCVLDQRQEMSYTHTHTTNHTYLNADESPPPNPISHFL